MPTLQSLHIVTPAAIPCGRTFRGKLQSPHQADPTPDLFSHSVSLGAHSGATFNQIPSTSVRPGSHLLSSKTETIVTDIRAQYHLRCITFYHPRQSLSSLRTLCNISMMLFGNWNLSCTGSHPPSGPEIHLKGTTLFPQSPHLLLPVSKMCQL